MLFRLLMWRKILRFIRPKRYNSGGGFGILLLSLFLLTAFANSKGSCQALPSGRGAQLSTGERSASTAPPIANPSSNLITPGEDGIGQWQGLTVRSISYEGVARERLSQVDGHLAQQVGAPLDLV
ncbi:MAG: hypothetical protein ACXVBV_21385, partial [Isosphaeraceae bacterium]